MKMDFFLILHPSCQRGGILKMKVKYSDSHI